QGAHGAHDRIAPPAASGVEDLDRALLRELLEALLELLALERVLGPDPGEDLRREPGELGIFEGGSLAEGVADAQRAGVEEADHVAGPGLLDHLPVRAEELARRAEGRGGGGGGGGRLPPRGRPPPPRGDAGGGGPRRAGRRGGGAGPFFPGIKNAAREPAGGGAPPPPPPPPGRGGGGAPSR